MAFSTATPASPLLARKKAPVPASLESGMGMGATAANPYTPGHWTQSILVRALLGVGMAVGLGFAFTRLTEGVLLLMGEKVVTFWDSLLGFIVWQAGQAAALFLAAVFATAGRRHGLLVGLFLGAVVGFGTMLSIAPPARVPGLYFALLPTWHILAAVLGSVVGEAIWHPPSREKQRGPSSLAGYEVEQSLGQFVRRAVIGTIFANVRWLRILIAAIVIVLALRFMGDAVNYMIRLLDLHDLVNKVGLHKGFLVTLLQVVVVFVAAGLAGATQNHGPAHGFWTGVIACVVNLLLHVFFPKDPSAPIVVNEVLLELGWVFLVALVAGGIGALVMPPMIFLARKRRAQIKTL